METTIKTRKVRKDKGIKRGPRKALAPIIKLEVVPQVKSGFKLVDKCPRSPLIEGRSYGFAPAFVKREGNVLTTVGPLSPCKDYLNDQVYSERTGKPFGAWGYHATKRGIFGDGNAYLVIGILPNFGGSKYHDQQRDTDSLEKNHKAIAAFVNHFEELLKLPTRTTIEKIEDNRFLVTAPDFWSQYTYLISLYTLFLRVAIEAGWDGSQGDPLAFFKGCKTGDAMRVHSSIPKLEKMLAGTIPVQDFNEDIFWHDEGIVSFNGFSV